MEISNWKRGMGSLFRRSEAKSFALRLEVFGQLPFNQSLNGGLDEI